MMKRTSRAEKLLSTDSRDLQSNFDPSKLDDEVLDLTRVTGDGPAAVLLIDTRSRSIVYANDVAKQLAPGVSLPASLDSWSDAAVLKDADGQELSETDHPMSKIALQRPVSGQAVSAARRTALGEHREPLWLVALPLSGATQLNDHALVVLLPVSERKQFENAATAARAQAELRDRAVLATGMSFTMADAQAEDMPLIWVNPAFTTTTGYTFDEAVGNNCRFLQGRGTDPEAHVRIRRALDSGESFVGPILNYRKDGSAFWNQLSMSPIHDSNGTLTHFVGIQTDITSRVVADEERDRALASEKDARQEAEAAQQRLTLLAEATSQLAATLDVRESLDRLSTLVVPLLADWVILATVDFDGSVTEVVANHRDGHTESMKAYEEMLIDGFTHDSIIDRVCRDGQALMENNYSRPEMRAERASWVKDGHVIEISDSVGAESAMFIPMPGRDHVDGVMILLRSDAVRPYTEADLSVASDLGRRAGLILDNARLYQSEHRIAETLQLSLLPEIPKINNVKSAARYRASEADAAVGGDFYELIPLPSGSIGFAIGDVVGHDVFAAAAMGHLRGLLRACAWDDPSSGAPQTQNAADVLSRVDDLIRGLDMATMATVTYASLVPKDDGTWTVCYSSAGHLPMMLRRPDGTVEVLDQANGLLLGVQDSERPHAEATLTPGSTLFAYTDGLVERRNESLEESFKALSATISAGPGDPEAACDHLLQAYNDPDGDDVAILVVQV